VERPFGLTVPFSTALEEPISDAIPVTTAGEDKVVKIPSPPLLVPSEFCATSR